MIKGILIGDPVAPSISHQIYPKLFSSANLDLDFQKINISKETLADFFQADIEYDFLNITMPHKRSVLKYCDILSNDTEKVGAVNFIIKKRERLIGYNLDGPAALNVIESIKPPKNKKMLVVGTGSSGKSTILEALKRGYAVCCTNRTTRTGRATANFFDIPYIENPDEHLFNIIVNCTNIGMSKDDRRIVLQNQKTLRKTIILDMASRSGVCLLKYETSGRDNIYISGTVMFQNLAKLCLTEFINIIVPII